MFLKPIRNCFHRRGKRTGIKGKTCTARRLLSGLDYSARDFPIPSEAFQPGSSGSQEDRFLLRKDGTWVLNITAFTLPEKEQEQQFIFQNAAELYATVQELGGQPVVEDALPPGKSRAELDAAIETTISRVWSQIKEARARRLAMPGA